MDLLFFTDPSQDRGPAPAGSCDVGDVEVWTPSWRRVLPRGLLFYPFAIWWLFHYLRIFKNRQYRVILVRDGGRVIHRSTIVPCYFRFPFMQRDDVQVGVWTEPEYRGRGLTGFALGKAVELTQGTPRQLWYIVREANQSSVRVAEKQGLVFAGRGSRVSRLGLKVLGKFVLETQAVANQAARPSASKRHDPVHSEP